MQNRLIQELSQKIADETCSQLKFLFLWKNPILGMFLVYKSLPRSLEKTINDEIKNFTQNIQLSPTQQEIFNQLSDKELDTLCKSIAGKLEIGENFNIKTYEGMTMTGLAAAYFKGFCFLAASVRLAESYAVQKPKMDKDGIMPAPVVDPGITYCALDNDPEYRKKCVIKELFKELQKFANEEQNNLLLQELTNKGHADTRTLAKPRGVLSLFTSYSHTASIAEYENSLFASFENFQTPDLTPMGLEDFKNTSNSDLPFPKDVHKIISSMLDKKDFSNLACINKESAKIYKAFAQAIKEEINDKRQKNISKGY